MFISVNISLRKDRTIPGLHRLPQTLLEATQQLLSG